MLMVVLQNTLSFLFNKSQVKIYSIAENNCLQQNAECQNSPQSPGLKTKKAHNHFIFGCLPSESSYSNTL